MKSYMRNLILLLIAMLLMGGLLTACGGGDNEDNDRTSSSDDEEEEEEEEEEPEVEEEEEEPEVEMPDMTAFSNEILGVDFDYPEEWVLEFDEEANEINLGSSQDVLDDPDTPTGAIMNMLTVPAADLAFFGEDVNPADPVSVLEVFQAFVLEDDPEDSMTMTMEDGPTETEVNGQPAAVLIATAVDEESGEEATIELYVVTGPNQSVIIFSGAENSVEDEFRPLLNGILDTLVISEVEVAEVEIPEVVEDPPLTTGDLVSAGFLIYGDSIQGSAPQGGNQAWEFTGITGETVDITVTPVGDFDVVVDVVDAAGSSISGEVDASFGEEMITGLNIPADGIYYIVVRGFADAGGDYALTLAEAGSTAGPGTTPVADGSFQGTVAQGSFEQWEFVGTAGQTVDITVTPAGDFDAVVDVVDAAGASILPAGEVDASFGEEIISGLTIPADGSYFVVVRGFADAGGDFTITLGDAGSTAGPGPVPAGDGTPIAFGQMVVGTVDSATATAVYSFNGNVDDIVGIVVNPDFDITLDVLDPAGNSLFFNTLDRSFVTENALVYLSEPGPYTILVAGYEGETGSFELTLSQPFTNLLFAVGDSLDEEDLEDGHSFPFYVYNPGDMVGIYAEPFEELDVTLRVYDGDGNFVQDIGIDEEDVGFDFSFGAEEFVFMAPTEGSYSIRVAPAVAEERGDQVGDYEVTLLSTANVVFQVVSDDLLDADLNAEGFIEYDFSSDIDGGPVTFEVVPDDSSIDLVIELLDFDGNVLASIDDAASGETETLTYETAPDTTIIVRISDFFGNSGGFVFSATDG